MAEDFEDKFARGKDQIGSWLTNRGGGMVVTVIVGIFIIAFIGLVVL